MRKFRSWIFSPSVKAKYSELPLNASANSAAVTGVLRMGCLVAMFRPPPAFLSIGSAGSPPPGPCSRGGNKPAVGTEGKGQVGRVRNFPVVESESENRCTGPRGGFEASQAPSGENIAWSRVLSFLRTFSVDVVRSTSEIPLIRTSVSLLSSSEKSSARTARSARIVILGGCGLFRCAAARIEPGRYLVAGEVN